MISEWIGTCDTHTLRSHRNFKVSPDKAGATITTPKADTTGIATGRTMGGTGPAAAEVEVGLSAATSELQCCCSSTSNPCTATN